ncbi:MAG TPA: hypothetical protein VM598_02105 [Bdellovibrionota bacterium]|nr:hypothetical protein [Bdellovibrionota bacterium]
MPASLVGNLEYFRNLGFDHLVLELRPAEPESREVIDLLAGASLESLAAGVSLDYLFGRSYVYAARRFRDAGFTIVHGDLDFARGGAPFDIVNRDRHFIEVLDGIVARGGKPLLLVGSSHIPHLSKLYYDAGKKDDVYPFYGPDSEGKVPCETSFYRICGTFSRGLKRYLKHENFEL